MKHSKQLFTLLILIFTVAGHAQKLDFKWSDKMIYNRKTDGFFEKFVGTNSSCAIALFNNGGTRSTEKVKLIAFDKTTMKKISDVVVLDRKNPRDKEKYDKLVYYKTISFENNIYVFWEKSDFDKQELYVQSFNGRLTATNSLRKVYEISSGRKNDKKGDLIVLGNKNNNEQIIIGGELPGDKGKNVQLEFKVLNADFSTLNGGIITMPVTITGYSPGLNSSYEYGDDGNLHAKTYLRMNKEQRKNLKNNESAFYSLYSVIDVKDNSIKTYTFKFDNKNIFNFGTRIDKTGCKIFGFFCDIIKDPRGQDTHGIFCATIDGRTKEIGLINFAYFTKDQLDRLYSQDKEDRKKTGLFSSKKKQESESESLGSMYEIEQVISVDADNLVLFCTIMNNYYVRYYSSSSNGFTTYRDIPYCEKSNVTVFKINTTGNIMWASNLDRKSPVYDGWNIYDLKVISSESKNKFLVAYGSAFDPDAKKKNFTTSKSGRELVDNFEYAVFDYGTGEFTKEEYIVNTKTTQRVDRKFVNVLNMQVIDNRFYIDSNPNVNNNGQAATGCFAGGKATSAKSPGYLGTVNLLN